MPDQPAPNNISVGKKNLSLEQAQKVIHGAAGWFLWIAGLSVLNSIAAMTHMEYRMALGLGFTELLDVATYYKGDATPKDASLSLHLVHLVLVALACGGFYLLGRYARKGSSAAFLTGIILYGLDTGIFLALGDWLGVALHGFALFMLWGGYSLSKKLKALASLPPPVPVPLATFAEPAAQSDEA